MAMRRKVLGDEYVDRAGANTDDFNRKFHHPQLGPMDLNANLALYAWHSRHHVAHITRLRDRMGWK